MLKKAGVVQIFWKIITSLCLDTDMYEYRNFTTFCVLAVLSLLNVRQHQTSLSEVWGKKSLASSRMKDLTFASYFFQFYLLTFEKKKDEMPVAAPVGDWCRGDLDRGTF